MPLKHFSLNAKSNILKYKEIAELRENQFNQSQFELIKAKV